MILKRIIVVTLTLLAGCLDTGCAWLSVSSAKRRAGTYAAETTIEIDPRTGRVSATSSGDDTIKVAKLNVGDNSMEGFELNFNRSAVVLAQGKRAVDITPLLGQDVQLNQVWGDTLIKVAEQTNQLVSTVGGLMVQLRSTQAQTTQNRIDLNALIRAVQGTPLAPPEPSP